MNHRSPAERSTFKIYSINVNGGASRAAKLSHIMNVCHQFGISLLQDTRLCTDPLAGSPEEGGFSNPMKWKGRHFFSAGTKNSKGLLILINASAAVTNVKCTPPPSDQPLLLGRYQRLDFSLGGIDYTLHHIYAPANAQQRKQFYSLLLTLGLFNIIGRRQVAAGDLNCILSPWDRTGGGMRTDGAEELFTLLAAAGMVDAWRFGRRHNEVAFTHWSKGRDGGIGTGARLDTFLLSASALTTSCGIRCDILGASPFKTDHLPVLLSIPVDLTSNFAHTRFHFNVAILSNEKAVHELRTILQHHIPLILATTTVAAATKQWAEFKQKVQVHSRIIDKNIKDANKADLHHLKASVATTHLKLLHSLPPATSTAREWSADDKQRVKGAEAAWLATTAAYQAKAESTRWAAFQVQAVLEQQLGCQPTRFYHNFSKTPHPPTFIHHIRSPLTPTDAPADLTTTEGRSSGDRHFIDSFSSSSPIGLFRKVPTNPAASSRLLDSISSTISQPRIPLSEGDKKIRTQELWQAVKRSPLGKTPGLDGLPYEFYKFFFLEVGEAFCHVFNLAYLSSDDAPLKDLLVGLITLVHKGKGRAQDLVSSYRPITLLGCDIKLLSMIILDRAQGPTGLVVDTLQGAFLRGRDISENIQFMLNFIDYYKRTNHPLYFIITDLKNAYDTVDRDFFYAALRRYGFNYTMADLRWFQLFLSGTTLRILVNGRLTAPLDSDRGFPQGLNVSTTAFLLVAQTGHSRAHQLVDENKWIRPELPEALLSPHPLHLRQQLPQGKLLPPLTIFADDMGHLEVSDQNSTVIEELYEDIKEGFGVEISWEKCYAIKGTGSEITPASGKLGQFSIVSDTDDHRSLGIPVHHNHQIQSERAMSKFPGSLIGAYNKWSAIDPCLFERVHIIRSCLLSKFVYQSRHLQPSHKKIRGIQKVVNQLLRRPQVSLNLPRAQLPKLQIRSLHKWEGGLGGTSAQNIITSLQAKTGLDLFSPGLHPWRIGAFLAIHTAIKPWFNSAAVFVTAPHLLSHRLNAIDRRLRDVAAALSSLRLFRIVAPSEQSPHSVLTEPVLGNCQILGGVKGDTPLMLSDLTSSTGHLWTHLRHIKAAHLQVSTLSTEARSDLSRILTLLPHHWKEIVTSPAAVPLGDWVSFDSPDRFPRVAYVGSDYPHAVFRVRHEGDMEELEGEDVPQIREAQCRASSVFISNPHTPSSHLGAPWKAEGATTFYIGDWDSLVLDPLVWGTAPDKPLPCIKTACAKWRLTQIAALGTPGYIPRLGLLPPTFEVGAPTDHYDPSPSSVTGLASLEFKWQLPQREEPTNSENEESDAEGEEIEKGDSSEERIDGTTSWEAAVQSSLPPWVRNPSHRLPPRPPPLQRTEPLSTPGRDDTHDVLFIRLGGTTMPNVTTTRVVAADATAGTSGAATGAAGAATTRTSGASTGAAGAATTRTSGASTAGTSGAATGAAGAATAGTSGATIGAAGATTRAETTGTVGATGGGTTGAATAGTTGAVETWTTGAAEAGAMGAATAGTTAVAAVQTTSMPTTTPTSMSDGTRSQARAAVGAGVGAGPSTRAGVGVRVEARGGSGVGEDGTSAFQTHRAPWIRAASAVSPPSHREVAWCLLHGVLPCNAFVRYKTRKPFVEGRCGALGCGCQETLTHLFLGCERIKGAVDWFFSLWDQLSGAKPPLDPRVILLDDHRVWTPVEELRDLWQRLRLIFLYNVWITRCQREIYASRADGDLSKAIVERMVNNIKRDIDRDWTRTRMSVALVEAGIPYVEASGRNLGMSLADFERVWATREILCKINKSPQCNELVILPHWWMEEEQEEELEEQ